MPTVGAWAAPVALMAAMWFFSSLPDLSSGLGLVDLIGRKLLHALEYALLCFLWWRALSTRLDHRTALACAFAISLGYGAIDEYHQTFVEGRNGSPLDVAIAAPAASIAVLLLRHGAPGRAQPAVAPR